MVKTQSFFGACNGHTRKNSIKQNDKIKIKKAALTFIHEESKISDIIQRRGRHVSVLML